MPGAQLPVARRRCDHFTTLEGATLSASATFRTVCPSSSRAIARSRKSIEIARLIDKASIVVFINLNQIKTENGIPKRFIKKTFCSIRDEEMIIDLTGTSGPVAGSVNCGAVQTESLLRLAYKTMINPERAITGGSFETMTVEIPDECLFNAKEPVACEWYFTGLGLLADLMISCMSEAMPDRATAAHYGDSMVAAFFSVDPNRGHWIAIEPTAGGWGGRVDGDGESALINLVNGGFRNISAEVYETKFPIRVEEFSLKRDSGGAGRWRGGCGVVRRYKLLDECHGALWFERSKTTAWGLAGGRSGQGPANTISYPDGSREHPLKMRARKLPNGTIVETITGGGGGYGNPKSRPVDLVIKDVTRGFVSRDGAWTQYGVNIREDLTVDEETTEPRAAE